MRTVFLFTIVFACLIMVAEMGVVADAKNSVMDLAKSTVAEFKKAIGMS